MYTGPVTWANEMNFYMNHSPGAGSIAALLTWSPTHCLCHMPAPLKLRRMKMLNLRMKTKMRRNKRKRRGGRNCRRRDGKLTMEEVRRVRNIGSR